MDSVILVLFDTKVHSKFIGKKKANFFMATF